MLQVEQVCVKYDGVDILHDISFSVEKGENLAIIGPNGCGKTTLLRAVAGLIPYMGSVLLDGKSITSMKRREIAGELALLSQITEIYFSYSVYDTVMMGRYAYSHNRVFSDVRDVDRKQVESALFSVGMNDLKDRTIDTLSGGQLQRVFLAKIIVQNPTILLLDEPTNHLDLSYQIELIEFLKTWSENKKSVIGVLHDINLAMQLSDKVMVIDDGRVRFHGPKEELLSSSVLSEVYQMDIAGYMKQALRVWENV